MRAIERFEDRVEVTPAGGEPETFDEVVIAAHADQALAMLADATPAEREILGAFPYQANEAVLHTDRRLLPRRRRAWASWNYHLVAGRDRPGHRDLPHEPPAVAATPTSEYLRDAQPHGGDRPGADHPHGSPTRTRSTRVEGQAAQRRYDEIGGRNRTHYCGAYWGWGFHEDGVASAHRAVAALGREAVPA